MPTLDARLLAVANFVRTNSIVADVGTDHGYLICNVVRSGKAKYGYATDINQKPLAKAKETIESYGLQDKIELILCDGIASLSSYNITDVAIAGLGGELIASMIQQAPWVYSPWVSLVLQPMTRPEHLRQVLHQEGFEIQKEKAVVTGKYVYSVMQATFTGHKKELSVRQAWLGALDTAQDATTIEYFNKEYKRLGHVLRSETNPSKKDDMLLLREELALRVAGEDHTVPTL